MIGEMVIVGLEDGFDDNWRSTLSFDDVGKIVFTGNCLSARNEITDDDMISLIELIARAQNRQVSIVELAGIVRVDSACISAALAAYATWSRVNRPGLNFDLAGCVVHNLRVS
jgi:ABC-type transporter Mla MlaB component